MTDYKTLFGKKIKFLTTDLTAGPATEGELFYSDTDSKFKVGVTTLAWAAGGNLNTARYMLAGCGTQTAGLVFGGDASPPYEDKTEEYDGSSWTESGDLANSRTALGGCGTQTAGLGFGGYGGSGYTNATEEFTIATTARSVDTT